MKNSKSFFLHLVHVGPLQSSFLQQTLSTTTKKKKKKSENEMIQISEYISIQSLTQISNASFSKTLNIFGLAR